MTKRQKNTIPRITLHRPTGQARVRLCGRDHYLGVYGSDEAQEIYHRVIAEWLAGGRKLPNQPKRKPRRATIAEVSDTGVEVLTVRELVEAYLDWARVRYAGSDRADSVIKYSLKPMIDAFGSVPAANFSPNKLRIVRQLMIQRGWCRSNIGRHLSNIRGVFAWAASHERLSESVYSSLKLVEPLAFGSPGVRESKPKELVDDSTIKAIKPYLSCQVFALIRLAMLSGARMGELVQLRPMDISEVEVDGVKILEFTPEHHKTAHKGFSRIIRFGPVAAMVLAPFLNRRADQFCFSPAEAESERRRRLHLARTTPESHGNSIGTNRKRRPQRKPGDQYTTATVRKSIERAVNAHNRAHPESPVPKFSPHQLRHSSLTRMRDQFGIEATASVAGHHSLAATEIYSGRAAESARRVAMEAG